MSSPENDSTYRDAFSVEVEALASHTCSSQCDGCHTASNCREATRRLGDLILCAPCYNERVPGWRRY